MFYTLAKLVCSIFLFLFFPLQIKGVENIPQDGSAILTANHSNNMDPVALAMLTYRKIHYLAKAELFKNKILNWFFRKVCCIPVNRANVSPRTMINCMKLLKNGALLGIFPEGTRVKGERKKPLNGFVVFSLKTKTPVIPVHISSTFKPWHAIKIVVGEPIVLSAYYGKKLPEEKLEQIAENIMDKIYDLK